ncbi:hypothetical protein ANO11243_019960 [Dothideomycetidae sp. 11243]|nr:hypothetical protein ANO11243_019960 [fungal sp. No.11243]
MDHADRGAAALTASRYHDAIHEYTEAIKSAPTSPDYHIKLSTAYQRTSPPDFKSAFIAAEKAVVLAQSRAKRELIVQAQLRRAIALFGLERYADASFVLQVVKKMDPKEKTLAIWENKIEKKLSEVGDNNQGAKSTVSETPTIKYLQSRGTWKDDSATSEEYADATKAEKDQSLHHEDVASQEAKSSPAQAKPVPQTPVDKIRYDWYQSTDSIFFTLLVKGAPKDDVVVDMQEQSLAINFPLVTGATYDLSLDPLYAAIDVSKSDFRIQSTKVEVTLRKAQPGQKWHSLEGDGPVSTSTAAISVRPKSAAPHSAAPSYPSSSRNGPKNWDKLADELTAKKPKKSKGNDGKEGDKAKADDDDDDDYDYDKEGGDEVNSFFKQLYGRADPDTRRAMMKSFQESNGTALSTNWEEVKKAKVPTQPPDGVEAKSWT